MRTRDHFATLALAAVSLLVGLTLGELLTRYAEPDEPALRLAGLADRLGTGSDRKALVLSAFVSDPDLFWRLKPDTNLPDNPWLPGLVSNRQGLREPQEIPRARPDGEFRVLFLGDSCTFGWGVSHEQSLVSHVESALQSRSTSLPVQCINAGVPGYTAFQGLRFLLARGFAYQPNLIVVTFGNNESVTWDGFSDLDHHAAWLATRPPAGLRWSALAGRAWRLLTSPPVVLPLAGKPRLTPSEFRDTLRTIREEAAERGIDVLLLTWPIRENVQPHRSSTDRHPLQKVILDLETSDGAEVLDLVPLAVTLAKAQSPQALYIDTLHARASTNAAYGTAVANHLGARLATATAGDATGRPE